MLLVDLMKCGFGQQLQTSGKHARKVCESHRALKCRHLDSAQVPWIDLYVLNLTTTLKLFECLQIPWWISSVILISKLISYYPQAWRYPICLAIGLFFLKTWACFILKPPTIHPFPRCIRKGKESEKVKTPGTLVIKKTNLSDQHILTCGFHQDQSSLTIKLFLTHKSCLSFDLSSIPHVKITHSQCCRALSPVSYRYLLCKMADINVCENVTL